MGLFSGKARARELQRVEEAIRGQIAAGRDQFVVRVNLAEGGGRSGAAALLDDAKVLAEGIGCQVAGVDIAEWQAIASLSLIRPQRPQMVSRARQDVSQATPARPTSAAPSSTGANLRFDDPAELDAHLSAALAPWSSPGRLGSPFGPGFELEPALAATNDVDAGHSFFAAVAGLYANRLIDAIRQGAIDFDTYDSALGLTPDRIRAAGLDHRQAETIVDAADEGKMTLAKLSQGDSGTIMRLADDVALQRRVFTYHRVVFGRLTGG